MLFIKKYIKILCDCTHSLCVCVALKVVELATIFNWGVYHISTQDLTVKKPCDLVES